LPSLRTAVRRSCAPQFTCVPRRFRRSSAAVPHSAVAPPISRPGYAILLHCATGYAPQLRRSSAPQFRRSCAGYLHHGSATVPHPALRVTVYAITIASAVPRRSSAPGSLPDYAPDSAQFRHQLRTLVPRRSSRHSLRPQLRAGYASGSHHQLRTAVTRLVPHLIAPEFRRFRRHSSVRTGCDLITP
jgi:hypothetical protein